MTRGPTLRAVIFDLDGVLTDTAELHYESWRRVTDEEGIAFSRARGERLRGRSRRRSLEIILDGTPLPEGRIEAILERKNRYFNESLATLSPDDLLPGIAALLDALDAAGIPYAVGSASRNARAVLDALGITDRFALVADGALPLPAKPAPDLFLHAVNDLGCSPADCVVVEDAESGIAAALTGGFATVGIGPEARVGQAHLRLDETGALDLDALRLAHARAAGWRLLEREWVTETMHHKETIFTVGNGLLASRGVFEEGYPGEQRSTFVHGLYDDTPVGFTELANIPDWMALDLRLDGERFSLAEGRLLDYERWLDLRSGLLVRRLRWESPGGRRTALRFERLLSLADREQLAIRVSVRPENWSGAIEVRGGLFGYPDNQGLLHWNTIAQGSDDGRVWLHSRTRHTALEIALATRLEGNGFTIEPWDVPGQPTLVARRAVREGERVGLVKWVGIADSRHHARPLETALETALDRAGDFDAAVDASRHRWLDYWADSDVEIDGDDEAQLSIRHSLFQMLAVAPQRPEDDASIGAKTLSGFGYRGHVFWDTELFMLPFFTFTQPELARNLLLYRYRRLAGARRKARAGGYRGAQFPWESAATGDEVTPTWLQDFGDPRALVRVWTGEIEIHVTADIAFALIQYWRATGDDRFMIEHGAEIVLDGATFWADRAEWNEDAGCYGFRDVIGPDEYHDHVDNNFYTNAIARWHLVAAGELLDWLEDASPDVATALRERLELHPERWSEVAEKIWLPVADKRGLIEQFEGYFDLDDPDPRDFEPRSESLQRLLGIEGANRAQFIKQPDVLMWIFLMRDQVSPAQLRANWEYYDPRTDHTFGSSLGPAITAVLACELGEPDLAYEHFIRAARADLRDVRGNAADGIHAASAGALWQSVTMGFGGFRLTDDGWSVEPRLPAHWRRLAFTIRYRGERHRIEFAGPAPA